MEQRNGANRPAEVSSWRTRPRSVRSRSWTQESAQSVTARTGEKAKERRIPFVTENRMHIFDANRLFNSDPRILVTPACNRHAATLGRNRQREQPQDLPALEHELALFR